MAVLDDLRNALGQVSQDASDFITGGGVVVELRTNYTPAVEIYRSQKLADGTTKEEHSFLGKLIGFRAGVVIRTADGHAIQNLGDPAPIDPVRAVAAVVVLGLVGLLIVRGIVK